MIALGEELDGKYVVARRLGGGGFGEVFLADDKAIPHRQVAIKILTEAPDGDHSNLMWEMDALARFNHPHVVSFFHHFSDQNGVYLVMEFCPHGSLYHRLVSLGTLPEQQVFAWGVELCETLQFVHEKGIVHHDIKPQNILFAADDTIKLGDFGVANRNIGTLMYLPPEMLLGERVSRRDARIDVYALGLTLLQSLVGNHPFAGLSADEALQARIAHDFIPSELPRWMQEVLSKATHPTPELRFQTAKDFADAIRSQYVPYVLDGNRIKAHALADKAEALIRRRKWREAEKLAAHALRLNSDCVAALLAAGRCQLLVRHVERAQEYFSRAVSISPRTHIQKELGWISLEQGKLPAAISLLMDHLQRNAADYESYNLLLKCFYLANRFEAAQTLARTLINERVPNDCFKNNQFLCRMLHEEDAVKAYSLPTVGQHAHNPFGAYNVMVALEEPRSWSKNGAPRIKSKLLFEEYRFGEAHRAFKTNTLCVYSPDGVRHEVAKPIVTIGSSRENRIVLNDRNVSRRHCVVVNYPGDVWIYDLQSTVGTTVDGDSLHGRLFLDGVHDVTVGRTPIRIASRSDLLV